MAVGDVFEFASVCYTGSQNQINVFHMRVLSLVGAQLPFQTIADQISGSWGSVITTAISNLTTYKGIKFRQVSAPKTAVIITTNGQANGTLTGDRLPLQVSGLVSLRAASAPPRTRGRIYVPSPVEGQNDANGNPTAGYQTILASIGSYLIADHNIVVGAQTTVLRPVLFRDGTPSFFFDLTTSIVRANWATQRRRSGINRNDTSAI